MVDFKKITINNYKKFSFYEDFMKNSTQDEFVKSQIPFYHAVNNFPRALCYLGYLIKDSNIRLSIIENLYEEHGQGKSENFHINTYHKYLLSISNGYKLLDNPWITEWINSWFSSSDAFHTALRLSAIEYLYAPISASISNHIDSLHIYSQQAHYKKHAILDWEHGKELLNVALSLKGTYTDDEIEKYFNIYQQEFLNVFKGMICLTSKEVKDISVEPIAFYYLREDSNITSNLPGKNIIMICSGGEGVFNMLSKQGEKDLAIIDINEHQLNLFYDKMKLLLSNQTPNEMNIGKFEKLFLSLRNRFSEQDLIAMEFANYINKDKLQFAINDIFSRTNLQIIFGDDAVIFTEKSFSEHFCKVFLEYNNSIFAKENKNNIFHGMKFSYPVLDMKDKRINTIQCSIKKADFLSKIKFMNGKKADIIDLSNVGDWMPLTDFDVLLQECFKHLNPGGHIVLRKLLGNYDLDKMMKKYFETQKYKDMFYEETIIGKKR